MVKRAKSPDIKEDAKYLVVHHPYPLNANFELAGDHIAFALWVASVLGTPDPILGIHHKPSAWSTVIVEVERKTNLDGLLGEHRWNEVLKKPSDEEEERVSQIFYCIYRTTRDAQKDGWKRVHVESEWFVEKGWNLTSGPFKHPYPPTHWCPPLPEDPTNKNIARPLPVAVKPPPPTAPSLVPGSSQWVQAVQEGKPTVQQQSKSWTARVGSKGGAGRGRSGGRPAQPPQRHSIPNAVHAAVASSSNPANGRANPWQRIVASEAISSLSAAPSISSSVSSSAGYYAPPGLTRRTNTAPSSSSGGSSTPLTPPGLSKAQQSLSMMSIDSEDDGDEESVQFVPYGGEGDEDSDDEGGYVATHYEHDTAPQFFDSGHGEKPSENEEPVNLWASFEKKKDEDEEPLCSIHGKLCTKGICAERKRLDREVKKAKEAEERAAQAASRAAKKKKKKKSKAVESDEDDEGSDGDVGTETSWRRKGAEPESGVLEETEKTVDSDDEKQDEGPAIPKKRTRARKGKEPEKVDTKVAEEAKATKKTRTRRKGKGTAI